eukprot:SAG31_NODE_1328_length_8747_cov_11.561474_4_plen_510_part_00
MLRALQAFCEKDGEEFQHHRLLLSSAQQREMYGEDWMAQAQHACHQLSATVGREDGNGDATSASEEQSDGEQRSLLLNVISGLMSQPPGSSYRFWMASCIHKWAQAARWEEQRFLTQIPGFVLFVIQAVLYTKERCDNTHKVFFDLLAELFKFNNPLLRGCLDRNLAVCDATSAFQQLVREHVVNASVFIQCIALTAGVTSRYPPRALPQSEQFVVERDSNGSEAISEYRQLPARLLKQLADQRNLDRSRCLEKADLINCLRQADSAAAATATARSTVKIIAETANADGGSICPEPEPEEMWSQPGPDAEFSANEAHIRALKVRCGTVAAFIEQQRAGLAMRLIDALDIAAAEVDNLCVINAILLLFMTTLSGTVSNSEAGFDGMHEDEDDQHEHNIADEQTPGPLRRGLFRFVQQVLAAPAESQFRLGLQGKLESLVHLGNQLAFWEDYYNGQASDRAYMEFSSGIEFADWQATVRQLKANLTMPRLRRMIMQTGQGSIDTGNVNDID